MIISRHLCIFSCFSDFNYSVAHSVTSAFTVSFFVIFGNVTVFKVALLKLHKNVYPGRSSKDVSYCVKRLNTHVIEINQMNHSVSGYVIFIFLLQ